VAFAIGGFFGAIKPKIFDEESFSCVGTTLGFELGPKVGNVAPIVGNCVGTSDKDGTLDMDGTSEGGSVSVGADVVGINVG
jgi:hypothetical protein